MEAGRGAAAAGAGVGMELCWRSAWGVYTVGALLGRSFPLPGAAAAFLAAEVLTRLSRGRGWRVFQVLGVQVVGLALCCLEFLYPVTGARSPWWSPQWLQALWESPKGVPEWLSVCLALFWAGVFWMGGVALARRPTTYRAVCTRFDVGIASFLGLFLVRWLAASRAGVEAGGAVPEALLCAFWIFGLFAVLLARHRGEGRARFLPGRRGLGVLLSIVGSLVFLGSGAILLFVPYLTTVAELGYGVTRRASAPLGPIVLRVLRFLLLGEHLRSSSAPSPSGSSGGAAGGVGSLGGGGWERVLGAVVKWGLAGLLGAVCLGVLILGAWRLVGWLLSRTSGEREARAPRRADGWLRAVWCALRAFLGRCRGRRPPFPGARTLYADLRAWGVRSGVPPVPSETALEFRSRLSRRFPRAAQDIGVIVSLFSEEVYGGRAPDGETLAEGLRAQRRLRSPHLWLSRLGSRLIRSEGG